MLFRDSNEISTWPTFIIKTFQKNVTPDVLRNSVMSLLCFKEYKHFKTNKVIVPNDHLIAMINYNR